MRALIFSVALSLTACNCDSTPGNPDGGGHAGGSGGSGGAGEAPTSITVEPADAGYQTDGVTPAKATYKATGTFAGGRTEDISARARFTVDDVALGSFMGPEFKSAIDRGGASGITATLNGTQGHARFTLNLRTSFNDPKAMNLPPQVGTLFGKTPVASRAPQLVYPNDGALVPPNLGRLEIHFLPGNNNTVFELSARGGYTDVKVYLRCSTPMNGGCIYEPDPAVWTALATANRGSDITLTLRGTDDTGTEVGESTPLKISFSLDDIQGGLYYWTTTTKAIMRFDFAAPSMTTAQKFVDAAITNNPGGCVGCHALSRDGKKMVVEAEGSTDGRIAIVDVASKTTTTPFPAPNKSFFESWAPDSTRFVGVDDRGSDFNLRIFDGTTGALLESIDGTGTMARATDHPDWSADGNTIAYASVTREGPRAVSLQWPTKGAIRYVRKEATGWAAPVEVAPWVSGKHRFYPAISPSSDYLVFEESTCSSGETGLDCDADTDVSGKLFAAKLAANAKLLPLTRANAPGIRDNGKTDLTNTFPKWSPFNFKRTGELGSKLQWLTFSSSRKYGLRDPGGNVWLWMVAIDPDQVLTDGDPSFPAFCLPFQDLTTSNHIAQWTEAVIPSIN
ncbi:MAG: PD40 domain-containing protein [Archangiaceae bacterium]|nr:PD40 domain-containing protein [Archangiaceae bacterium]